MYYYWVFGFARVHGPFNSLVDLRAEALSQSHDDGLRLQIFAMEFDTQRLRYYGVATVVRRYTMDLEFAVR